jgi:hypothetical protein
VLAYLPLYHNYGLFLYHFLALFAPMTMLSLPRWDIETALKVIPESVFNLHYQIENELKHIDKVSCYKYDLGPLGSAPIHNPSEV